MSGCKLQKLGLNRTLHRSCSPRARAQLRAITAVSCLVAAVSFPPDAAGQPARDMVGKRVVQKSSELTFRLGKTRFSPSENVRIYRVVSAEGLWLWLKSESGTMEGWANADDVIPVDGSVEFFTARIAKDPRDPFPYAAHLHSA